MISLFWACISKCISDQPFEIIFGTNIYTNISQIVAKTKKKKLNINPARFIFQNLGLEIPEWFRPPGIQNILSEFKNHVVLTSYLINAYVQLFYVEHTYFMLLGYSVVLSV